MSPKFNNPKQARQAANPRAIREAATSAIATESTHSGATYEGGAGFARDAKSELFLLAVANMVGENTFYETGSDRDDRFERLVHQVAVEDTEWTQQFLEWLRTDAHLRSASIVGGLEAAKALRDAQVPGGRQIVASVLQRADEPGEALAYWLNRYGRTLPMPVIRGIADGALSLYNEYSLLKYDTASHAVRFGDVIELTHPGDKQANQHNSWQGEWQKDLFKHAIERRHGRDNCIPGSLPMIDKNAWLRSDGFTQDWLNPEVLRSAGMTWEDVLSAAGPDIDKAVLWEALIPTMGYMAVLRNLRNFDEAGISSGAAERVNARLADPEQVAKSRQFPFRFLSAHRAVSSVRWAQPLETALNLSLANVPKLPGRTLVLVDRSGSMFGMAGKSQLNRADQAAVFGAALALRNPGDVDLVEFGTSSAAVPYRQGDSLLRVVNERFHSMGGTNTSAAVRGHYANHDRVVIVTDEQAFYSFDGNPGDQIPAKIPMYTWNLAGYRYGHAGSGKLEPNRHTFGGLTDAAFRMIPLLEAGTSTGWPWEH